LYIFCHASLTTGLGIKLISNNIVHFTGTLTHLQKAGLTLKSLRQIIATKGGVIKEIIISMGKNGV
jgi:hypothetical protein